MQNFTLHKSVRADILLSMSKTAVVAIIGRPSAGKSSFLNAAGNQKISIVSPHPQTTRNAVRGIVNTDKGQLVFIDTPGYHQSDKKLNLKLKGIAEEPLQTADLLLYVLDSTREAGSEEKLIASLLQPFSSKLVVAVNKIDSCDSKPQLCKLFIAEQLPSLGAARVFNISAKTGEGIDAVLAALYELAPEGEALYPEEYYTDQEVDFRIAEVIREQAVNRLRDELPHAVYVEIADMESRKDGRELWVRAFLVVERESQKGMVIGKGASLIKSIRVESIKAMRRIFDYRIDLDLQVKVNKNWRQKDTVLAKILK